MNYKLYHGDCLEVMKDIPDRSVDMILCDLPYGFTDCEWDSVIPLQPLWQEYHRILKRFGVCVLFGNEPFTSSLISSNKKEYSHVWYWKKQYTTGYLLAKKQPLRCIEDIIVFHCNAPSKNNKGLHENLRNYFFEQLKLSGLTRKKVDIMLKNHMSSHYFSNGEQFSIPTYEQYRKLQQGTACFQRDYSSILEEYRQGRSKNDMTFTYNPQGVKPTKKYYHERGKNSEVYRICNHDYVQTATSYPKNLLEIDGITNDRDRLHPTQKPTPLLEYLIKTYSNEGETVLDNCMGSGSTGVACINTNRNFIGIELDDKYFEVAKDRMEHQKSVKSVP